MLRNIGWAALLLLLILFAQPLAAQNESDNNVTRQIWLDYNITYPIADRIVVLSKGKKVHSCRKDETCIEELERIQISAK